MADRSRSTGSAEKRKMFLQSFLSKGVLNAKDVRDLLLECGVDVESKEEITKFVLDANTAITPFHLEIKKAIQEEDGASFYCLVNTVETAISRLSSTYTSNELELFKKLVEQIVDTEDGKIGSLAALSLTDKLEKRMGKEEAQNFLDRLERDRWIQKVKRGSDGKISLTVRSILELEQYLKDMYPDFIKMCYLCRKICLLGEICGNCGIKIHIRCSKNLFNKGRKGDERKCPARDCRAPWGQVDLQ